MDLFARQPCEDRIRYRVAIYPEELQTRNAIGASVITPGLRLGATSGVRLDLPGINPPFFDRIHLRLSWPTSASIGMLR